ncbi:5'-3' exoribonuclease 3-like protein [Carex littledalei]|uniref:5'-3' exoribonuclease n=1 Tax=Carex littledalei TaxID=544730 RepID=A0A833VFU2_9POAL|nr:5'-3' exoribonuclease 3-like protein [Carex littledalei]
MGVPSFYRWLVVKYPKIKQKAIEVPDGSATEPNPNGIEFDNLYLDMNCIIHPCFHPEDELFAPKTYDDVFQSVFEYIDRIFNIVRPRKLLYMAVADGVAPRAKMNQQRARRFSSARSAKIAELEEDLLREEYKRANKVLMPKEKHEVSDSIVITPGTIFMERLSKALEYYIRLRLNSNPAWMKIKVILSDANVPGEGEHKIMSFIRSQQNSNGYNPNLRHCLYGLDADLIMLALTTHELYFYILREVSSLYQDVSGQNQSTVLTDFGQGLSTNLHEAIKSREWYKVLIQENKKATPTKKPYELVNICILREYLEFEMKIEEFKVEMDRVVDDFVFICIFMGNDFLPNIPSLEAHENALDLLMEVYKRTLRETGGYLIDTAKMKDKKHAYIKISRVEKFIADVGTYEDKIFLKRNNIKEEDATRVEDNCSLSSSGSTANNELAVINNTSELKRRLKDSLRQKQDTYKLKTFQDKVEKYMEGLCWVLQYYFVGVCSWTCYEITANIFSAFPTAKFSQPFKPFDQLMAVLPPQSSAELPSAYAELMKCKDSKISEFYPEGDTEIDMDGKRFIWQGIIKLPSINEDLLLESTKMLESQLQIDEIERNSLRKDIIFIRNDSALGLKLAPTSDDFKIPVDFASCEISGVLCNRKELEDGGIFLSPIQCMDDIRDNIVISAEFLNPVVGAPVLRLLENVEVPDKTITANDVQRRELWHESSSRQTTTKFDNYRKDVASSGHSRDTWRCAGSDRSGSTGRGWRNATCGNGSKPFTGNHGRGFPGGHETHHPSSSLNRGRGSDGSTALARGTNRPEGAVPSVAWGPVDSRPAGRGRAQN